MIDDSDIRQRLRERFSQLAKEDGLFAELTGSATAARLPSHATVCIEGQRCGHLALVLDGRARVHKLAESGRDITLYRIGPGQSCILTTSCILAEAPFPAQATAETDLTAVLVPSGRVRSWLDRFPAWRDFVFGLVTRRLVEVIAVVEEVAFERIDVRISRYLLSFSEQCVRVTHQEIADELGTSREVVTRVLRELESSGLLQTGRGEIRLLDEKALARRGGNSPSVT